MNKDHDLDQQLDQQLNQQLTLQQRHKINQVLRHQGTEFDWLLKQIEQQDSSDWANRIEITLTILSGFGLLNFYEYSQQNELNMRYFIFALIIYIMVIAMRNLQKRRTVESRINLLAKALRGINQTLAKTNENNPTR